MGKVIDFNEFKTAKGLPTYNPDDAQYDDALLVDCPTCAAPCIEEEGEFHFDEEAFLDFLSSEAEDFVDQSDQDAVELKAKLDVLAGKISKNEEQLKEAESKVVNRDLLVLLYNLHQRLKDATKDDPMWVALERIYNAGQ